MSLPFGEYMQMARMRAHLSQRQLSEASGVSLSTIGSMERSAHSPNLFAVIACANVLGVGLDEYVGREVPENGK